MKKICFVWITMISIFTITGCKNNVAEKVQNSESAIETQVDQDNFSELIIHVNGEPIKSNPCTFGLGQFGLPAQEIAEKLGYITTIEDQKLVIDTGRKIDVELKENGKVFIDGEEFMISIPPMVIEDTVYILAPDLGDLLSFEYEVDHQSINIKLKPLN